MDLLNHLNTDTDSILSLEQLIQGYIKNRKYLEKKNGTWYLVIRNETDTQDILRKALKDISNREISDIQAGIMAKELKSIV